MVFVLFHFISFLFHTCTFNEFYLKQVYGQAALKKGNAGSVRQCYKKTATTKMVYYCKIDAEGWGWREKNVVAITAAVLFS